jgi:hypothetical protein
MDTKNNNKDVSQESFILIRFEHPNSTKIMDFKQNNIDEFQMIGASQMLELIAKKIMMDGMSAPGPEVEPPKLYKPN